MTLNRTRAALALTLAGGLAAMATLAARAPQGTRAWPPALQPAPTTSPVLSPEDSMKTFFLPPGYRVELVASEPLVQDPVADRLRSAGPPVGRRDARLHAGHRRRRPNASRSAASSCSRTRTTTGGWTRRTVFLDGLVLPRALKVLDRGVLVGEPPNLWLARDTNGDLRADTKELVTNTYGRLEANVEHNANSLLWALDNWMYTSEADVYLRLKNGRLRGAEDALARPVGRVAGRCRPHLPQLRTSRCCTSTSCRRRTSRAIRTCCGRAAATNRSAARTTK